MKKEYTNPEFIITSFEAEDIITASGLTRLSTDQSDFKDKRNFSDIAF